VKLTKCSIAQYDMVTFQQDRTCT